MAGRLATLAAALVLLVLGTSGARAGADPAFGRWVVEGGQAVIEIAPCGDEACGRLVWMRRPLDAAGAPKRDAGNPDPEKRDRRLCGLRLVTGLTRTASGVWDGGRIYSARDGRTYGFEIKGVEGDRMTVRGYLGVELLGRSRVWTRADGSRGSCMSAG